MCVTRDVSERRETTELGDGVKDQGITVGFPSMHEEGGTILVFVLRRIGSRGGAGRWPLTLGWVV